MSNRIRVQRRAVEDIDEIAGFIRRRSEQNARRFVACAYGAIAGLTDLPEANRLLAPGDPELGAVRCGRITRHPNHLVLHRIEGETIRVLRVVDAKRRDLTAGLRAGR